MDGSIGPPPGRGWAVPATLAGHFLPAFLVGNSSAYFKKGFPFDMKSECSLARSLVHVL
jgi:hypothetical protein